jgi:hypothetical protein
VATNLATLFAGQQGEVLLVDADPQQSALKWQRDRPAHLPQVSVIGLPAPNLHREILRLQTKYGVILIDGGGRVTATARATVAVADFRHYQLNRTPLYSLRTVWHTCSMKAAPRVRSARFSSNGISIGSCHEPLHVDQPIQTSSVSC